MAHSARAIVGGVTIPVEIRGRGGVAPNLPGGFIADVLQHFAVADGRQDHKQWLLALLAGIRHRQPFDSSLRTALAEEITTHFRGNEGDFTWLKNRLHRFARELQQRYDDEQRRHAG